VACWALGLSYCFLGAADRAATGFAAMVLEDWSADAGCDTLRHASLLPPVAGGALAE